MNQSPQINIAERDAAIHQVESNNDPSPNDRALQDMKVLLSRHIDGYEFTSDTLVPDVGKYGFTDNRAVGPLMIKAVRLGWIRPTDRHRNSQRQGNHCVPRRIYINTFHSAR